MIWILAFNAWVKDKHRALWRFAGYRRAIALSLAYPVALVASLVFGLPSSVANWPLTAQDALAGLVNGVWRLALGGWIAHYAALCEWLPAGRGRRFTRLAGATFVVIALSAGLGDVARALATLAEFPAPAVRRVVVAAIWCTALPLVIGLAPLAYVSIDGWIGAVPVIRRLLHTGMAPGGGWMDRRAMKKHIRPLPKNLP